MSNTITEGMRVELVEDTAWVAGPVKAGRQGTVRRFKVDDDCAAAGVLACEADCDVCCGGAARWQWGVQWDHRPLPTRKDGAHVPWFCGLGGGSCYGGRPEALPGYLKAI